MTVKNRPLMLFPQNGCSFTRENNYAFHTQQAASTSASADALASRFSEQTRQARRLGPARQAGLALLRLPEQEVAAWRLFLWPKGGLQRIVRCTLGSNHIGVTGLAAVLQPSRQVRIYRVPACLLVRAET